VLGAIGSSVSLRGGGVVDGVTGKKEGYSVDEGSFIVHADW
jgi:hypothetical protein